MEEGVLSLKWNNHNSTFIHMISKLQKIETYSDLTLACEGKYFPVHKLVLSVCSEYFEEVLGQLKGQQPVIIIYGIRHTDLQALLNYMYLGEANVAQSELSNFIKAAECLRIKGLAVPDENPIAKDKSLNKKRKNDELNSKESCNKTRKREGGGQRSEDKVNNASRTVQDIPEVILDPTVEVKQEFVEPKVENEMPQSDLDYSYSMNINELGNGHHRKPQSLEANPYDHLSSQHTPGPSVQQENDVLSAWDSNLDDYSLDYAENLQPQSSDRRPHPHEAKNAAQAACERPWYCSICGYAADRASALEKHVRKHTGEKPYTCHLCPYSSAQKSNLQTHQKTEDVDFVFMPEESSMGGPTSPAVQSVSSSPSVGGGWKHWLPAYPCTVCPKQFPNREDLRRHHRTHTGEKPFSCPLCPHRSSLKGNITKHLLAVHKHSSGQ